MAKKKITHKLVGAVRHNGVVYGPGDERKLFTSDIPKASLDRLLEDNTVFQPAESDGDDDEEDGREQRATGISDAPDDDAGIQSAIAGINRSRDISALRALRKEHKSEAVRSAIDDRIKVLSER